MTGYQKITQKLGKQRVKINEPMSRHTWLAVGGCADLFFTAQTKADLIRAVLLAKEEKVPFFVFGGGSNILVADKGIRGLVINNQAKKINLKGTSLTAQSGTTIQRLVDYSINHCLAGLHYFAGLPGTLGGAVWNNSHFQDHLIADQLIAVEFLNEKGKIIVLGKNKLSFAYDYSCFQEKDWVILEAVFKLEEKDKEYLQKKARESIAYRRQSHPMDKRSAGCFFKNPPGQPAGQLIDKAGLKGQQVGGAKISAKHAGFFINTGEASCQDMLKLARLVKKRVWQKFKVKLEREVVLVGETNG